MSQVQEQVVQALMKPQAYPEGSGKIELVQTHISFVFLTKNHAYKVKKAVNLGFVDFTTLESRRFLCEKELQLNRRLCDDMYLGVVPINMAQGTIAVCGKGVTVEYAVKMRRMPQDKIMTRLLEENQVDKKLLDKIAKIVASFHAKAETSNRISEFGNLAGIKRNWDENFDQTLADIGITITDTDYKFICTKICAFMEEKRPLFNARVAAGKIRDCHGDIHSGNIFVTDQVYIFDAVEVNDRFRYSDVASDVAFLAMDLEFKGRADLSEFFVNKYVQYSGDAELRQLLPFYKCYRAYVRGKVLGFRLNDPHVSETEKKAAKTEATAYFKLATTYAKSL